jgi:hypothetical protein
MKHQTEPEPKFGALIDEPNPFDPVENWERHLADLKTMPKSTARDMAIQGAEKQIARIKLTRGRG